MRRRNLLLAVAGVALLALAAYAALNAGRLRRAWILEFTMTEAAPGVLLRESLPEERRGQLLALAAAGRARADAWYGGLRTRATLVLADDEDLKLDLDLKQPLAWNPPAEGTRRVYIGPRGLNEDVIAHGLAHAEIKERVGMERWGELPAWFDEGLAAQVDLRPFLVEEPVAKPVHPDVLAGLRGHQAFTGGGAEDNLAVGKREVTRWLSRCGGRDAALRLLDAVRGGEAFDAAYARIEAAAAP